MRRSQRSQFDYHSYRGRTGLTSWLKRTALALAVLVVVLVAALVSGQGFISYTDEGLRFDLPFFSQQEPAQSTDPGSITVVEGDPADLEVPVRPEDDEEPEPAAPQAEEADALLSVTLSQLLDGSAARLAREAGADGVVVDMKDDLGALGWQSQQELASSLQEGVDPDTVNAALEEWGREGLYTAARLSCFRDEALGSNMDYTLRTSSDYRWMDGEGGHWTTPANEAVRDYLTALMAELAQLGFDEIVLDHWGYPTQGDGMLSNLGQWEGNYPAGALDGDVTQFLEQAARALEPYGTVLSLYGPLGTFTLEEESTGLTIQALNEHVGRIWTAGVFSQMLDSLEEAGVERAEERLVALVAQLDATFSAPQAVWIE